MIKNLRTNQSYTIKEIKRELKELNPDIIILSQVYENNKQLLECYCLVCEEPFEQSWNSIKSKNRGCPACGKNGVKISKPKIKEWVREYDYEIVEFTGIDSNKGTTFNIKCFRGHVYNTNYREFNREEIRRSGNCKTCRKEGYTKRKRDRIKKVLGNIIKWGYTTSKEFEYKDSSTKYKFICSEGHTRNITYHSLERTPKCPDCHSNPSKHTDKDVRDILDEMGLTYIGGYTGADSSFNFICECGESDKNTLKALRKGIRCRKCNIHKRYLIEDVVEIFAEVGFTLLEDEYIDNKTPMKYICDNGHHHQMSLNSFQTGTRCKTCHFESVRGENSPHWNPNLTNEVRVENRKYPEYEQWRLSVYERDNYTCQCCGDNKGGNLNAHHLDGYDWAIDLRLDINNGVTLCEECHIDYHNTYGYKNSTKEHFEEYMIELYELKTV